MKLSASAILFSGLAAAASAQDYDFTNDERWNEMSKRMRSI